MSKTKSNGKATKSEPSDLDTIRDTVEQAGYSRPVWPMGNYTLPTPFRAFTAAAQGERQLFKMRVHGVPPVGPGECRFARFSSRVRRGGEWRGGERSERAAMRTRRSPERPRAGYPREQRGRQRGQHW